MIMNNESINQEFLFCDETEEYRSPIEPEPDQQVKLYFRTAKDDADRVCYIEADNNIEVEMIKEHSDEMFDYYMHQMETGEQQIHYFFQIVKNAEVCYYNRLGVTTDIQSCYSFCITPGFHTPEWAKGAVMYQIFVDRFCQGDETNDVESCEYVYIGSPVRRISNWNETPSTNDVGHFYGGDLQGVWNKLDYLQRLGVEVIYFNPLFVSPSNHKYDCQDYDHIDPHYGVILRDSDGLVSENATSNDFAEKYTSRVTSMSNLEASDALFARFMEEIHKRGMKVIIDGVFNHCGSFNKWMDRELFYQRAGEYESGAYVSVQSPYHTFFKFYNENPNAWPYNANYDGWWGHATLPKLNYEESPKLCEYILNIAKKWVSPPYSVDGWRLDVAADLGHSGEFNHHFWREFRKTVKKANPDALILAEHYGDPSGWLQGDQWDTVMNYDAFMEPITWFLTGMEKHSDEYNASLYGDGESFFRLMRYHMSRMQISSLQTAMNQLSNHDHSRFLTRTNQMVGRLGSAGPDAAEQGIHLGIFREAVLIQMTWPGAPTLYYGDEAGVCGWTDPDSRRTYPWGHENLELIEFHRYMINIHKELISLRKGSVKELKADSQMIAYGRMYGEEKSIVIVNNSFAPRRVEIPVRALGIRDGQTLIRRMVIDEDGYNVGKIDYKTEEGLLVLDLNGTSGILLTTGK